MIFPLETGARAGAHDMTERDIVDDIEPAMPLTLSKEGRTALRRLVKEMAPLYSI